MIDAGFNLLAWAVLKRRSIQFVDRSLCDYLGDQDPYEKLFVEKKGDLNNYRAALVSLARGMSLGKANLFADMAESQRWISQIIYERSDDEVRIGGKAIVNDEGDCLARISVEILSRRKNLQMTIECNVLGLIYPTRTVYEMTVYFWDGADTSIAFDIGRENIDNERFFAALKSKKDCRAFVEGCRIFAAGPDALAEHLRGLHRSSPVSWNKKTQRYGMGNGEVSVQVAASKYQAKYSTPFRKEEYDVNLYDEGEKRWRLKSTWYEKFEYIVNWGYEDDFFLLYILDNNLKAYDAVRPKYEFDIMSGEDLPDFSPEHVEEEKARQLAAKQKKEWKKKRQEALRGVDDLTSNHAIELPIERVHINDLIVRSRIKTCANKDHTIRSVIAIVCVFSPPRGVFEVAVDAFCCPQCKRYYVLQKAFDRLQKKGALCCKIITKQGSQYDFLARNSLGLSDKSIYKSLGYNVNADEGLSASERRSVLDFVIQNGFRTQKETIEFLQWLISYNGKGANMGKAVQKWESDIEYLINGGSPNAERVKIDRIFLTKHGKWD